jgi:hypothetical protein
MPPPFTLVAALLEVHGSGVWPGRHNQTVLVADARGRIAAPAVGGDAVSVPAPISTARDAARSQHADPFPIAEPPYELAIDLCGHPSQSADPLRTSA